MQTRTPGALALALLLATAGGCRGYFVTGGGGVYRPELSSGQRSEGVLTYAGGGIRIPVNWIDDNPLHGYYGIPDPEVGRPLKMLWEGWLGYAGDVDTQDFVLAGTGVRLKFLYERNFYTRFGAVYQDLDPNVAWGGYWGLGYDIYLDRDLRWSIAPEITGMFMVQETGAASMTDHDTFFGGTAGIFLTYHWKAKTKRDPPLNPRPR